MGTDRLWLTGTNGSKTQFSVDSAIILYCIETDLRLDIPYTSGRLAPATDITSILGTGTNTIQIYLYNGPTYHTTDWSQYYERGGILYSRTAYLSFLPP